MFGDSATRNVASQGTTPHPPILKPCKRTRVGPRDLIGKMKEKGS